MMQAQDSVPSSVFDPRIIVLAVREGRLRITDTLKVARAVKGIAMRACPVQPPPEWISGHGSDGSVSAANHMAVIPLPLVGCWLSECDVAGFALVVPRGMDRGAVDACLGELAGEKTHRMFAGRRTECRLGRVQDGVLRWLDPGMWTGPSRTWASVTPVVLDRHCDGHDMWDKAEEVVSRGCVRIGLPEPESVSLSSVASAPGIPNARRFPPLMRKNGGGAVAHTHAVCVFGEEVAGPVIIGAGRFRGYGMFVPLP